MTNPKILCAVTHGRVKALIKQLQSIEAKQRYTDVDQTRSATFRVRQLHLALDFLRRDYAILDGLPEKLRALVEEWLRQMARIEDDASRDDARQKYLDFLPETEWQTNIAAQCDEVLRQLATCIRFCEETIQTLTGELTTEERARVDKLTPLRATSALLPSPQKQLDPSPPATDSLPPPTRASNALAASAINEAGQQGRQESYSANNAGSSLASACERASRPANNAGGSSDAVQPPSSNPRTVSQKQSSKPQPAILPRAGLGYEPAAKSRTTHAEARHKEPDNVSVATSNQKQLSKSEESHFPCAFCNHHGHTATHCLNYGTLEKRLLRAARQCVCVSCCSVKPEPHLWKTCPHEPLGCSFCKHRGHHQAFCRAWLRIFTSRISRRQPQANTRKNPTRGRSPSLRAKAVESTTAKPRAPKAGIRSTKSAPCSQFRCTCHRQDCNYVIPLPWKTTDARTDAEVTEILQATRSLTVGVKDDTAQDQQAASSQPLPSPARQGWTAGRGGARSSPRRPATNNVAGVSASLGLAANNAAGILGGCGRTATALPSRNAANGLKAMMCSTPTSDYEPCGQCRSCSGPLHVGADGKPFIGATRVVPPDFDVAPACHIRRRPLRRSHYPRIPLPRLRRVKRQHDRQENPTRGGGGAAKYRAGTPELDSDDPTGPNPRLSEEDQRALEAALDSDNESYARNGHHPPTEHTYGSAYVATPYARPLSPSGGFGPFTGHENETPEDYASTAGEEYDWPDEPTSTATLTPYSTGCGSAHEPVPLLDPGASAQQTSRGDVYEDYAFEDDLYDDRSYGGVPHDDRFYGNDVYWEHAHEADLYGEADCGGDFYDDDSVRWA